MTPQEALSSSFTSCKLLTSRYLSGFNSLTHTRQAAGLPNHVAWCLGHAALTMHRAAAHFDGGPVPESDFSPSPCTPASDDPAFCFFLDSIALGSSPVGDPAVYPSFERCTQVYEMACDRLAAAVLAATPSALERKVAWGSVELPLIQLIPRIIFHNGMHTGQIADLRRALGMPSIFG
jgi:hypothetical protein